MEALGLFAPEFLEFGDLLQGLDALRRDVQVEGAGDDGGDDGPGCGIDTQVADEAAVDLDAVDREVVR